MQRKRGAPALIELLRGGTQRPPSLAVPPMHGGTSPPHGSPPLTPPSPASPAGPRAGAVGVGPGGGLPPTQPLPTGVVPPSGSTRGQPAVAIEPKPGAPVPPARSPLEGWAQRLGRLPRPVLYLVPAGVLVFLLGWTLAYQLGSRARDLQDPRLSDSPSRSLASGSATDGPADRQGFQPQPPPAMPPDPLTPPSPGLTPPPGPGLPAQPPLGAASLQPGVNYLVVANLFDPRGEHIPRCQQYLGENGVNTVAIKAAAFTTNPRALNRGEGWWVLVALPGFAGDQFRASSVARQELEGRVQGLGRRWQAADKTVPTNFAAVFWAKHDPAKD